MKNHNHNLSVLKGKGYMIQFKKRKGHIMINQANYFGQTFSRLELFFFFFGNTHSLNSVV